MKRFRLWIVCMCLGLAIGLAGGSRAAFAAPSANGAKDGQQAVETQEQESGDNVYRHSASVRFLGRLLHLDQEAAANLFEYLNFAILAGAVLYFLAKNLPKTFRDNRENIQHQLTDARKATQEAHDRLAAIEQRLSRLDGEIAAISQQAEKDSAADEARIKESIEAERVRIVDATAKDIAAAASAAQRDLKRFAAGLAVDRAMQRIVVTEDDDRALMLEFTRSLAQQGQGGGKN